MINVYDKSLSTPSSFFFKLYIIVITGSCYNFLQKFSFKPQISQWFSEPDNEWISLEMKDSFH